MFIAATFQRLTLASCTNAGGLRQPPTWQSTWRGTWRHGGAVPPARQSCWLTRWPMLMPPFVRSRMPHGRRGGSPAGQSHCLLRVVSAAFLLYIAPAVGHGLPHSSCPFPTHCLPCRVAAVGPEAAGRRAFPGTTACVALLAGSLLAVANLGDSRAVLCRAGQVRLGLGDWRGSCNTAAGLQGAIFNGQL